MEILRIMSDKYHCEPLALTSYSKWSGLTSDNITRNAVEARGKDAAANR